MAEVNTGGGEEKKGKPKKQVLRVDFTPMVDMNMLLITFFMFCTSLVKPQVMNIVMPTKDDKVDESEKNKIKQSHAITILLGEDHKVYYYTGMLDPKTAYADWNTLKEAKDGIRSILLERNATAVAQMKVLNKKHLDKKISDDDYKTESDKIKNDKEGQVAVIKPTDKSTYKDLVDALDEMQICSIGRYAIVEPADGDKFLIKNYQTQGKWGEENGANAPK